MLLTNRLYSASPPPLYMPGGLCDLCKWITLCVMMYSLHFFHSEEEPVSLSYRNDTSVTVQFRAEVNDDIHIVLNRKDAADLKNLLDIWLER